MTRRAGLLGLLVTICLLCPAAGLARDFSAKSLPVPVNVEGERVRSSLFLRVEVQYYNMPLARFGAAALDEREKVFFRLADGIRRGDYARVGQVLQPESEPGAEAKAAPAAREQGVRKTVDLYRAAFGGFENVEVVCQVLVGSRSMFVWTAKTGSANLLRAFSVGDDKNKEPAAAEVGMQTPMELMVLYALDYSAKQPDVYRPVSNLTLGYQYPLPVDGPGNPGPHPVYLQFNGEPVNFEVFGGKPSSNQVLSFYRNAYLPLKSRLVDSYLEAHTPKSQAKLRQWYSTMAGSTFDDYLAAVTKAKYVKFLLDADPVYILFYSEEPSADWKAGTLRYQYVVRDASSKEPKIANVLYESFLDDVLKSNELFDQGVLKKPSGP